PALSNSTPVRKPKEKKPSSSKPPKEETGFGISESKTPDPVVKPPVVAPRPAVVSAAREAEARLAIQEGRYVYYKVKRKDTLESISKDFQIPTEMIRTLNFIPTGNLQKGQSLRLPDIR
ncbi:MAG: LysM peptidoglycan-binding domain-containing protein, partial [Bacteroidota bacterium]